MSSVFSSSGWTWLWAVVLTCAFSGLWNFGLPAVRDIREDLATSIPEEFARNKNKNTCFPDSGITFRSLNLSDVDNFMKWYDDFPSKEAAIEYVATHVVPHPWYKAICVLGQTVGSISVTPFYGDDGCRAEIRYVVGSDDCGKGIETAAVREAAKEVFLEWGHLERLEAVAAVGDTASHRVLEEAGFEREGVLRKYYLVNGRPTNAVMFSRVNLITPFI